VVLGRGARRRYGAGRRRRRVHRRAPGGVPVVVLCRARAWQRGAPAGAPAQRETGVPRAQVQGGSVCIAPPAHTGRPRRPLTKVYKQRSDRRAVQCVCKRSVLSAARRPATRVGPLTAGSARPAGRARLQGSANGSWWAPRAGPQGEGPQAAPQATVRAVSRPPLRTGPPPQAPHCDTRRPRRLHVAAGARATPARRGRCTGAQQAGGGDARRAPQRRPSAGEPTPGAICRYTAPSRVTAQPSTPQNPPARNQPNNQTCLPHATTPTRRVLNA
jgi:hypothetical protein